VTGPARNSSTDDEARWAEAMASLEHGPTPAVRARLRRLRLLILAGVVVVVVPALLIPLLLPDRPDRSASDDPATALDVAGLVVMTLAILVEGTALVLLFRANRGRGVSPLVALNRRQNLELRAYLRDETPTPAERVPLVRHLGESMLRQRPVVLVLLGAALLWTGMILLTPSWWRGVVALVMAGLVGFAWTRVRREERVSRRFLAEHPAPPT
jgi:hypothetical protein